MVFNNEKSEADLKIIEDVLKGQAASFRYDYDTGHIQYTSDGFTDPKKYFEHFIIKYLL